ncbi:hypothetical protein [Sharpea azabuensis]|uniref:hypothetical protein n=1 Tax=Sharpea azabuensis TaxID=322505 RepID=UPI003D0196E1
MKKQFKVLARLVTTAVMAAALSGCSSQGAGKKKTPEKKISLSEKAKTLTEGESFTLKVKNGSEKMDAKSKNPSIAALEKVAKTKADYKVTAVKAGETEIVFKKDSKTYSCKVTVNAKPAEAQPQQDAQAQAGTDAQQSSASQSGQPAQSSSQSAPSSSASAKNGSSSAKSSSSGNASSSSQRSSVQKSQSSSNKSASSSSGSARKSANSAQSGNKGSSNKSTSTGNKGGTVEVERQWTAKNGAYGGTLTDDQAHKLLGDDYDDFMKHPIVDND